MSWDELLATLNRDGCRQPDESPQDYTDRQIATIRIALSEVIGWLKVLEDGVGKLLQESRRYEPPSDAT